MKKTTAEGEGWKTPDFDTVVTFSWTLKLRDDPKVCQQWTHRGGGVQPANSLFLTWNLLPPSTSFVYFEPPCGQMDDNGWAKKNGGSWSKLAKMGRKTGVQGKFGVKPDLFFFGRLAQKRALFCRIGNLFGHFCDFDFLTPGSPSSAQPLKRPPSL